MQDTSLSNLTCRLYLQITLTCVQLKYRWQSTDRLDEHTKKEASCQEEMWTRPRGFILYRQDDSLWKNSSSGGSIPKGFKPIITLPSLLALNLTISFS